MRRYDCAAVGPASAQRTLCGGHQPTGLAAAPQHTPTLSSAALALHQLRAGIAAERVAWGAQPQQLSPSVPCGAYPNEKQLDLVLNSSGVPAAAARHAACRHGAQVWGAHGRQRAEDDWGRAWFGRDTTAPAGGTWHDQAATTQGWEGAELVIDSACAAAPQRARRAPRRARARRRILASRDLTSAVAMLVLGCACRRVPAQGGWQDASGVGRETHAALCGPDQLAQCTITEFSVPILIE